jgi:hypothetical protein
VKDFQVDILCQVFTIFREGDHPENDMGYQTFGIFYDDRKRPVVPVQDPVNQFFIRRIISDVMVHVSDQTAELGKSSNKTRLLLEKSFDFMEYLISYRLKLLLIIRRNNS